MRVNVRRSPPRRAEGIKLLRLRVAPSAVQTLIKYTIPVSGLDGLVEEKKGRWRAAGKRERYREASGPALFDPLEETWEDGRTEGGEGGRRKREGGGLILKKYTHTREKRHS